MSRALSLRRERGVIARPAANVSEGDPGGTGPMIHSASGQLFRNAIVHSARSWASVATPQRQIFYSQHADPVSYVGRDRFGTLDSRGLVIREQGPLIREPFGQHNGFQDFIGVFFARVARVIPVVAAIRYQGQLPLELQPKVIKPDPWNDPTRGRP